MPSLRPFVAVGLWVGLTASATAIVWAGTSTVAANLTDRPAPVVAHGDVVTALESGAPAPTETTPGITAPGAAGPPGVPSDDPGSGPRPADGVASAPTGSESPDPEVASPAPPETPAPVDPGTPPTTQPPTGPSATYSTPGGVVTVACENNFFIRLVSATPNNGYETRVRSAGPYTVEVSFVRSGLGSFVSAFCMGQPVRAYSGIGPGFGMGG